MTTKEEWKPVAGWEESHEVSNIGRVRTIPRKGGNGRILSQVTHKKGYLSATLCYKGTTTTIFIHRLVLTTFCGNPPPDGKSRKNRFSIKHKDGNNRNNHVDNLQWLTIENSKAFAAGGKRKAEVLRLIEPSPPEEEPMTNESTPVHFRMAKAAPEQVESLRDFLELLDDREFIGVLQDFAYEQGSEIAGEVLKKYRAIFNWRRIVEGYQVLVDNACDPALDYLEFKPEIREKPNVFMIEVRWDYKLDPANDASNHHTLSIHSSLELAIERCREYANDDESRYIDMISDDWNFAILECEQDPRCLMSTILSMNCVMHLKSNGEPFETEED